MKFLQSEDPDTVKKSGERLAEICKEADEILKAIHGLEHAKIKQIKKRLEELKKR